MSNIKKRILSSLLAGAMLLGTSAVFAEDTAANGKYTETEDTAAKTETENLYNARPVTLRQMEALNRGVVAVKDEKGTLVSWRMLGTDPTDIAFNVYREGVKLNGTPISNKTNFYDEGASNAVYTVVPVINGQEVTAEAENAMTWANAYKAIPVKQYECFYNDISLGFYDINDVSVGDLDGDGEYEVVVRRNPPTMDLSVRGTNYPLIEAYKMDGTHMWTINIGPNEVNDVDINFLVYDFNKDGKAEIVTRSFEGTVDGAGNVIGDIDGDGKTNYEDSLVKFPDRQYLSKGPEFLSMYDGMTGKELSRTDLLPARDPVSAWSANYTDNRLVKRASHFLFSVAYLDGVNPSVVHVRGAWDVVKVAAWDFKGNDFNHLWTLECEPASTDSNIWGSGYHSMAVADVDFDGKDEILSGAFAVDNDGKLMYTTKANGVKLGHGDAFDVAMMDPDYKGYYVWACQESKNLPVNIGLHDARTGQVLYGYTKPKDTGRSRAADIDPTSKGWEVWGSTQTQLQSFDGKILNEVWNEFPYKNADGTPVKVKDDATGEEKDMVGSIPMSFKAHWDGDLLAELVDGVTVYKYNWEEQSIQTIFDDKECTPLGGTKAQPCLIADIFGDWREEIIFRTTDNKELRIYSTNIPTDYKMPTLMHDVTYREAVAWQNNHYNQPTNTSFYLGYETTEVPVPEIYTMKDGKKTVNPVYETNPNVHAAMPVYTEPKSEPVILQIGRKTAIKDGGKIELDVAPIIADGGRTMVPIRFLSETFGADVKWDEATKSVTVVNGEDKIVMTIGSLTYTINGEENTLDVPAQIIDSRTLVPVRAVLEAFGKKLYWNETNSIIAIDNEEIAPTAEEVNAWVSQLN